MCNPSFSDSLSPPSPSSSSYSSKDFYGNNQRRITRKPSIRSIPLLDCDSNSNYDDDEKKPVYFLDSCFLCKTPLHLGDDIYMYKGDTPFCSEECREEQIEIDETREKDEAMKKRAAKKNSVRFEVIVETPGVKSNEMIPARAAGCMIAV